MKRDEVRERRGEKARRDCDERVTENAEIRWLLGVTTTRLIYRDRNRDRDRV